MHNNNNDILICFDIYLIFFMFLSKKLSLLIKGDNYLRHAKVNDKENVNLRTRLYNYNQYL